MILLDTGYAKLNLALHVRGKLADGRHRIETIFAFCEDGDALSAEPAEELGLQTDGPFATELGTGENLILQAARALQAEAGVRTGARFLLSKRLPVASGIGGGSADAGAALRMLTRLWSLDPEVARKVAPALGSDVPACLASRACRGTSGGEELRPFDHGLACASVLLVNPLVRLATGKVFAGWDGQDRGPLNDWRNGRNDLEGPAIAIVPQIAQVLEWLRAQAGTEFVRMSGSGATCFALFESDAARDAAAAAVAPRWWHLSTGMR